MFYILLLATPVGYLTLSSNSKVENPTMSHTSMVHTAPCWKGRKIGLSINPLRAAYCFKGLYHFVGWHDAWMKYQWSNSPVLHSCIKQILWSWYTRGVYDKWVWSVEALCHPQRVKDAFINMNVHTTEETVTMHHEGLLQLHGLLTFPALKDSCSIKYSSRKNRIISPSHVVNADCLRVLIQVVQVYKSLMRLIVLQLSRGCLTH